LSTRSPIELNLGRQPTAPFVTLPDGRIQNALRLRVSNKTKVDKTFSVALEEPPGVELITPLPTFDIAAGQIQHVPLFVAFEAGRSVDGLTLRVTEGASFSEVVTIALLEAPRP
jgi:hypothetical protein